METRALIDEFCKTRPDAEVIVGYGSGVKAQANDKGLDKQIDLILGVKDATKWHQTNYEINPTDYSRLGYKFLPYYQNLGTKINYLSFLPFKDQMFKIGVISTRDMFDDLLEWNNFYLAGRFQKSVEIIKSKPLLDQAIKQNRLNALKAALLLSKKETITKTELFENLCSLSFIGDWRRILHIENLNKIHNIVNGSFDELEAIYEPLNSDYYKSETDTLITIDFEKLLSEIMSLPLPVDKKIYIQQMQSKNISDEELMKIRNIILSYFIKLNIKASAAQPVKGILINGVSKTKTYLKQKIEKK